MEIIQKVMVLNRDHGRRYIVVLDVTVSNCRGPFMLIGALRL